MLIRRGALQNIYATLAMLAAATLACGAARGQQVTFAGIAFAGDHSTIAARFPYLSAIDGAARAQGKALSQQVVERVYAEKPAHLAYAPLDTLTATKGNDQILMSVLLLTAESVSTEQFADYTKSFINLRGEAVIFDYKTKTLVRSYPVSVTSFDASPAQPTPDALAKLVRDALVRPDGGGLVTQYTRRMAAADLPTPATRTFQVRRATITPEAMALLPQRLQDDPAAAAAMASDALGAVLSSRLNLSLLPTSLGDAMGKMSFRLDNGDAFDFKIGEGDYLFDLALRKFVKVKSGENDIGASWVYGVHTTLTFVEPSLGTKYLSADIKNGEVKQVPAGQQSVDDFPAYEAALRGLFIKLAAALQPGADLKWINTATTDKTISQQLDATRAILKASK